jgi:adenylosuccinate lyase
MNAEFSNIINGVIKTLESSTRTSWTSGDLDDWSNYAKRMKESIFTNTEVLKHLASIANTYEAEIKKISDRNDKLEEIVLTKIFASNETGK